MSSRLRSLMWDVLLAGLLFYLWGWVGVWFNQDAMRSPTTLLPITEFTEGHLAATVVGIVEWEKGSLFDLYVDDIGWPDGLVYRPMMWPSIALGVVFGPVLAINLLWSYALSFNAICGFFLVRVLGMSRLSALVAGSLCAWNPWVRTTLSNGQFEQAYIGVIALIWGVVLLAEKRLLWGVIGTFMVVLLSGLAVPNCTLTALVALPILGIWRVLHKPRRLGVWTLCALATIFSGSLVNAYQSAGFNSDEPQFFSPRRADDSSMENIATIESLFSTPTKRVANNQVIHIPYQGQIWTKGAAVSSVIGGSTAWMGLLGAASMVHLSLGPSVDINGQTYYLPVAWLAHYAPILAESGSYYRFAMGGFIAFALCIAAGIHRIRQSSLVLSLIIGGYVVYQGWDETRRMVGHPIPLQASQAFENSAVGDLRAGKGAVLGLPLLKNMGCDKGSFGYIKEYWLHRRPILHTMEPPIRYRSNEPKISRLLRVLDDAQCASKISSALQRLKVSAIIVYRDAQCPLSKEQLACLEESFGTPKKDQRVWLWDGI